MTGFPLLNRLGADSGHLLYLNTYKATTTLRGLRAQGLRGFPAPLQCPAPAPYRLSKGSTEQLAQLPCDPEFPSLHRGGVGCSPALFWLGNGKLQADDGMSLGCLSRHHYLVPGRKQDWLDVLGKAENPHKGTKHLQFLANARSEDLVLSSEGLPEGRPCRPFPRPEMDRKPSTAASRQRRPGNQGDAELSHEGWVTVTHWLAQTHPISASCPVMTKLRSLLSHSDSGGINKLHSHPRHQGAL